jgi:hypothetical protein
MRSSSSFILRRLQGARDGAACQRALQNAIVAGARKWQKGALVKLGASLKLVR